MNPWEEVPLQDYEAHMQLDDVFQLQTLHGIMQRQLDGDARRVMILGVAGGNGLDLIDPERHDMVYGVDINQDYLDVCRKRYGHLGARLALLELDLTDLSISLPKADLIIANLFIEYIGIDRFVRQMQKSGPCRVSCVIQKNPDESFVSDSPYQRSFSGIASVHTDIEEMDLTKQLLQAGFTNTLREVYPLPNCKALIRLDYCEK
ncbi:class I SAM-dependent methyltransferase [Candidatus Soleaferrea massiliensis]|uniref:class I SAM-dependent methyltransferase n=1 Tax=Candidatus Soleaferrea massiliensis TaxID=1470354 RepID=UPI0005914DE2|nr:class I SAM-dependent methyltransferase [Candidatus Soleaferrea massiliensis]